MKTVQTLLSSTHYHVMALGFLTGLLIFLFSQLICFAAETAPVITPEQYLVVPMRAPSTGPNIAEDTLSEDAISYMLLGDERDSVPKKASPRQQNRFSCRAHGAWVACP